MEKTPETPAEILPGEARLSPAAEIALELLEQEFGCELGNQLIGSPQCRYSSPTAAKRAMLRLAYEHGRADVLSPIRERDFEADAQAASAATASAPDAISAAQGNLAYLLSAARHGERIDEIEEAAVRRTIERLEHLRQGYVEKRRIAQLVEAFERPAEDAPWMQPLIERLRALAS